MNLIRLDWDYHRRKRIIGGKPYYAILDTNNICNLQCPLCPTGLRQRSRPLGQMDFETFRKWFDQICEHAFILQMHNWGEPFLTRDIFKMIAYARERDVATMISANFNTIKAEGIRSIVSSGLTHLVVSIDGASQEIYKIYRRGGDFDVVIDNVRALVRERDAQGSRYPLIQWQFLVMSYNEHEIDTARKMGRELGIDGVTFYTSVKPGGELLYAARDGELDPEFEPWRPVSNPEFRIDFESGPKTKVCTYPWKTTVLNWDGGIAPCTVPFVKTHDLADLNSQSFDEIWNGEAYQASRALFRSDFNDSEPRTVCSDCTLFVHARNPDPGR